MIGHLAGIGRVACVASLTALLAACIILPLPTATELPEIVPHLPADLRNSEVEVLVLTAHSRKVKDTVPQYERLNLPTFMKAKDLASLPDTLKLEYQEDLVGGGIIPYVGPFIVANEIYREYLTDLCVIAADGRTFAFSGDVRSFTVRHQETLWTGRRDAIISALGGGGKNPFKNVDGPCGITGHVEWLADARFKVIEFLARIPERDTEPATAPVARLFGSEAGFADEKRVGMQRVMVLASTASRNRPALAEAPVFLRTADVNAALDAILASKGDDFLLILGSFRSGLRSLSNFKAETVCAISSDGRVVWWSAEDKSWKRLNENPPYREWKEDVLSLLAGAQQSGWDEGCAPTAGGWTAEDRRRAAEFVEKLPAQERPGRQGETLFARSRVLRETTDARGSGVMLFCHPWCVGQTGYYLTPFFLEVDDVSTLVERLKSSTRREVTAFLARLLAVDHSGSVVSGALHIHIMGPDGVMVELENERTMVWRERGRSRVSSSWRSDALDVLREDFSKLRGRKVPFLASTGGWPGHTRMRVAAYLERIPVADDPPAKH